MGQRLVVKIVDNSKENDGLLATAYYHWCGYTSSSFEILKEIVEEYLENEEEYNKDKFNNHRLNNLFKAIKLLEATGAGGNPDEFSNIFNGYKFNEYISRNKGIIDISEKGMNNSIAWAEALVEINLDTETIDFQAFNYWDLREYYDEEVPWNFEQADSESDYKEEDIKKINNFFDMGLLSEDTKKECLKKIDDGEHLTFKDPLVIHDYLNWSNFKFDDIYVAEDIFSQLNKNDYYSFVMSADMSEVYSLIE